MKRMPIICTICSKDKSLRKEPIPAKERYLGTHIAKVAMMAMCKRKQYCILSGLYGMVGGNTLIPYYDHLLTDADVPDLTLKVKNQLISLRVSEIDFYIEDKPSWSLYRQVLRTAATSLHIRFQEHTLPKPP